MTQGGGHDKFKNKLEYFLTALSCAVGLGNVWRFPYLVYKNGGGSFFIPYIFALVLLGFSLFYFEACLGQFVQRGPINCWTISPIFRGIGYGMCVMGFLLGVYYNMIVGWAIYYIYATFTDMPSVPWAHCNNTWNSVHCFEPGTNKTEQIELFGLDSTYNSTHINATLSPSQEFFYNQVLMMSDGIEHVTSFQWHLVLCLAIAWVLIFAGLSFGAKSMGKVAYFTAIFPYVVITALVINGATLDGAGQGIIHYLKPDFNKLTSIDVWSDACTQIFFSLSVCYGGVATLASYNPFHTDTFRDSLKIVISNSATSIYAGFGIFSVIGFMAKQINVDVSKAADQGVGLAFVAYPAALAHLPAPWLWSFLFFFMLIILGFGSQMTIVETVVVNLIEMFPNHLRGKKVFVLGGMCFLMFLCGLPMCTDAGLYILQVMDSYSVPYAAFVIGICEIIAITWVYGIDRHLGNLRRMMGYSVYPLYWKIVWKYLAPTIMVVILVLVFVNHSPLKYEFGAYDYQFPQWANLMGWGMTVLSVVMIPIFAIYELSKVWRGYSSYKDIINPDTVEHECTEACISSAGAIEALKTGELNGAFILEEEQLPTKEEK